MLDGDRNGDLYLLGFTAYRYGPSKLQPNLTFAAIGVTTGAKRHILPRCARGSARSAPRVHRKVTFPETILTP